MRLPAKTRAESKKIVGLAIRTLNSAESDPSTAKIPQLWEQFSRERWATRVEDLGAFGPTIAVYSAYESDVNGSYQLLVGREVRSSSSVPVPLQVVSTSPGSYLVFRCSGTIPQAIIDGWGDVWAFFAREHAPARAYTSDFEVYGEAGAPEIWVAVREKRL